jgi:lipid-binding SYLF domain-containing protein
MLSMSILSHRRSVGLVAGALALFACSSNNSSSSSGEVTQTTAAKVDPERAKAIERLERSTEVVNGFVANIPKDVAQGAQCVVAIPSLVKGGVIIGGASGKGYATCQTPQGWSAPAPVSVGGGSLGAQVGVQSADFLAIFTSTKGQKALLSGNFTIGVDASATAGPVGTGRGAATNTSTNADLVSYSRSKGLYAGADMNGAKLSSDEDTTKALYGAKTPLSEVLSGRVQIPSDEAAQRFISAVRTGFGKEGVAKL